MSVTITVKSTFLPSDEQAQKQSIFFVFSPFPVLVELAVAAATPAEGCDRPWVTALLLLLLLLLLSLRAEGTGVPRAEGTGVRTWGEETTPLSEIPMARRSALGRTWYSKVSSVSRVTFGRRRRRRRGRGRGRGGRGTHVRKVEG